MTQIREKNDRFIAYTLIGIGLLLHIIPFFFNRSLWLEEALLANSIINENFFTPYAIPVDDIARNVPLGYFYILKIFTLIFGVSKFSMRLWSLISYVGMLVVIKRILENHLKTKQWYYCVAIIILIPTFMYYGSELKPYVSDCFFVISTIHVLDLFQQKQMSLKKVMWLYSGIVWMSYPAVFYVLASYLIIFYEYIRLNLTKNKKVDGEYVKKLLSFLLVPLSLGLHYFTWFSKSANNMGTLNQADLLQFPLFFTSVYGIVKMISYIKIIVSPLIEINLYFALVLLFLSIYKIFRDFLKAKLDYLTIGMVFGTFILLFASNRGYYPIESRYTLFLPICICILSAIQLEKLIYYCNTAGRIHRFIMITLFLFVIYHCGIALAPYFIKNKTYNMGHEIALNIDYLNKFRQHGEIIYVQNEALPSFLYETKYRVGTAGIRKNTPEYIDPFIMGQVLYDEHSIVEDANLIQQYDSVYIFTSNGNAEKQKWLQSMIDILEMGGDIEIAIAENETYLYHYRKRK